MLSRDLKSTFGTVKERSANLVDKVKVTNVFGQSSTNNNAPMTDEEQKSQKGLESPLYSRLAAVKVRVKNLKGFLKLLKVYRENGLAMAKGDLAFGQQLGECKKYIPNSEMSENLGATFSQTMQRLSEFVLEIAATDFVYYDELSVLIEKLTVFIGTSFNSESEKNFETISLEYEKSTKQVQTFKMSKKWQAEKNIVKLYQLEQERSKIFKEYTKIIQEVEQYCDEVDLLISEVLTDIVLMFQRKKSSFLAKVNQFDNFKLYLLCLRSWCQQEEASCVAFAEERNQLRAANQNLQKVQYLQKLTYLFNEQDFADVICASFKDITYGSIRNLLQTSGVGLPTFLLPENDFSFTGGRNDRCGTLNIDFFKTNYDEIALRLNECGFKEHAISLTEILTLILDDECEAMIQSSKQSKEASNASNSNINALK